MKKLGSFTRAYFYITFIVYTFDKRMSISYANFAT